MEIKWIGREFLKNIKPYIPGKSIELVKSKYGLKKIIKMASNENPLGPSKKSVKAIKSILNNINIYPSDSCSVLKNKLAKKKKLIPNNIIIGNGSDELIRFIGESFLNLNDSIIVGEPSFSEHAFSGYLMGAKVIKVSLSNYKFDLKKILKNIKPSVKIIFICNPNNPTGTIVEEKEIRDFVNNIPENIILVFDEAYAEYAGKNFFSALSLIKEKKKNIIVLNTFSKIYGLAALRIGYGIACSELISLIERVKEPFNVNQVAQIAAIAAIDDDDHLKKSLAANESGKFFLYNYFKKRNLLYCLTSANFIWVNLKIDSKKIFNFLLKEGVIIRPGFIFNSKLYIRVTIGTLAQNKYFIKILDKILIK